MKTNKLVKNIATLLIILSIGFGCKYFQFTKEPEIPQETSTKITIDILKERLGKKGIEFVPLKPLDQNVAIKPNPLTLQIKFVEGGFSPKLKLNSEGYEFDVLVRTLKTVFTDRENNGVFKEGSNEVEKSILLQASDVEIAYYNSNSIYVEDFERLVDNLRKEGIDQIKLDANEGLTPIIRRQMPAEISGKTPPLIISGGVVNGKAVNLVKPPYPPAAKAVRASGAVNVQVLIDLQGNVESAEAVSGHALLRSAAVSAARASKFAVTMLSGKPVKVQGVIVYNFPASQ